MGFSRTATARCLLSARAAITALLVLVAISACSGTKQKAPETASEDMTGPPPACHKDEVREYLCDDLLPTTSDQPAAEPYQTCPSNVAVKGNVFAATSTLARFDAARTDWTRKRVPPGHACCYSYCSKLVLAEIDAVDPVACTQPNAMPERLCISTAEAGVSDPAGAPNELCAEAVTPPAGVSFTPPKAAALDLRATAERRSQGLSECCYGWCSKAPLGTGLGAK